MGMLVFFAALLLCQEVVRGEGENVTSVPDEVVVKRLCKFICACGDPTGTLSCLGNGTNNELGNETSNGCFHITVPSSIISNSSDCLSIPVTIHNKSDNSEIGHFELSIRTSDVPGVNTSDSVPFICDSNSNTCIPCGSLSNSSSPLINNQTCPCLGNTTLPALNCNCTSNDTNGTSCVCSLANNTTLPANETVASTENKTITPPANKTIISPRPMNRPPYRPFRPYINPYTGYEMRKFKNKHVGMNPSVLALYSRQMPYGSRNLSFRRHRDLNKTVRRHFTSNGRVLTKRRRFIMRRYRFKLPANNLRKFNYYRYY